MSVALNHYAEKHRDRVESVWNEGEDGYWAQLAPGWICPSGGSHCCHESTVVAMLAALRNVEPCDCECCRPDLSTASPQPSSPARASR